jgi:hypothetical protein
MKAWRAGLELNWQITDLDLAFDDEYGGYGV